MRTRVASNLSPWLSQCEPGDIHTVAISHGEGRFVCSPELQHQLEVTGRIATQYVDEAGQPSMDWNVNPNGSVMAIEGITSPDGRVLGKMGHVERDNIRQRQAEGIAAARARGVKLGRPALAVPDEFDAVHREWEDGCLNSRQAAESLGVSHTTFLKWVKQRPADVITPHK